MIKYIKQDISRVTRGVVAQGVNCQGVMGSGVAAALRSAYPEVFPTYKALCDYAKGSTGGTASLLGKINIVQVNDDEFGDEFVIINCFTQNFYGRDEKKYADVNAVWSSLDKAIMFAAGAQLPFYMPKIGCGLGGLSWETEVEPLVGVLSIKHNHDVNVCEL